MEEKEEKMKNFKMIGSGLAALLALSFNACSGDSSSNEDTNLDDTVSMSGLVVDGYLENAKVCLDKNYNNKCDNDEPFSYTISDGTYTLEVDKNDNATYPIIVEVIANKTIDKDDGFKVAKSFILTTPKEKHQVISPITTLVKGLMDKNSSLTLEEASNSVKTKLGVLDSSKLFDDYVKNEDSDNISKKLHKIAKVAVQLIVEIEEKIKNDLGLTTISDDQRRGLIYLVNDIVLSNINIIAEKINIDVEADVSTEITTIKTSVAITMDDLNSAIAQTTKSIVGSWYMGDASQSDNIVTLTFFDNGYYVILQDGVSGTDSGEDGMERGTYNLDNGTNIITFNTITDTNGEWGWSHENQTVQVVVDNNNLDFTVGSDQYTFNRVY